MQDFELNKKYDFIELNKLMKILDWVNSGGQANVIITEGDVTVNGAVATEKRKKIRKGDVVTFAGQEVTVK